MRQTAPLRSFQLAGRAPASAEATESHARPMPTWIAPELASLTHTFFWDPGWAYEEKLDGERVLARKDSRVALFTRNGQDVSATYPEVVDALSAVPGRWWLDGEVVALDKRDVSNFKLLQQRLQIKNADEARRSSVRVYYYVFDVMYLHGSDTRQLPYSKRRVLVNQLIQPGPVLRVLRPELPVQRTFTEACRRGWEGLIVKNLSSTYQSKRTNDWQKFKCVNVQELVVVGYTDPRKSRVGFGALLLGYYQNGQLQYAGKVGTGFDIPTLRRLFARMQPFKISVKPILEKVPSKGVHWLRPKLVAEVGFTEWTSDNKLRHPRYVGLRTDKTPRDVVKE